MGRDRGDRNLVIVLIGTVVSSAVLFLVCRDRVLSDREILRSINKTFCRSLLNEGSNLIYYPRRPERSTTDR